MSEDMPTDLILMGQGPARPADADDLIRDSNGYTHPYLHRRVDPNDPVAAPDLLDQEVMPRDYMFSIQKYNSYRTTTINTHDEESEICEIP